jgi:hypothetical protein
MVLSRVEDWSAWVFAGSHVHGHGMPTVVPVALTLPEDRLR